MALSGFQWHQVQVIQSANASLELQLEDNSGEVTVESFLIELTHVTRVGGTAKRLGCTHARGPNNEPPSQIQKPENIDM